MSKYNFDAVIFDLDGVITQTALVHSAAWKKMFDEYLLDRQERFGETFKEFSHENDYLPYVDGKPRYKGVESFLQSRGIEIPFGDPSDQPGTETICGLGNRKNQAFNDVLDKDGVEVYPSTVELIHELKEKGLRVGVASSSKNCKAVLEKAGLIDLVETRVDGVVSVEIGLKGKPEPDIFTTAADNLCVSYDRSVVVEDAVSGVQAGAKGNFGLVLGIARENNLKELKINGADIVVEDISEIGFKGIEKWFKNDLEEDGWSISYDDYDPAKEKTRETLLSVGNGYFGTRGAPEESTAGEHNYPGTYVAGLYNRLTSKVGDREVENEDFVNCPNWTLVRFAIDNGSYINLNEVEILKISRKLDLKTGLFIRSVLIRDEKGRETLIKSKRFASMNDQHIAGLSYEIIPKNYSGKITIETGIDGDIINDGVDRYKSLNQQHLKPVDQGCDGKILYAQVKTTQSKIDIAEVARINVYGDDKKVDPIHEVVSNPGVVFSKISIQSKKNKPIRIEKLVSIFTSQHWDQEKPLSEAKELIRNCGSFNELFEQSKIDWESIWNEMDVKIEGDRLAQKLIRLHMFHLIISMSPHNKDIDASITARGLHGEAYRGHIFWDELFILPFYNLHFKEVVKSAILYRYRRLDQARKYATEYGYDGAMFPWQSGSDGREETQVVHLNPVSGKWGPDFSSLQRHVSLAIAYNIWQYFNTSDDKKFISDYGAEMFIEITRFWVSRSILNSKTNRYEIKNVMGPDEFHEKYPNSEEGGLKDNSYTNLMVVWTIHKALEILDIIDFDKQDKLKDKIKLKDHEIEKWKDICTKMNIVHNGDILAQYDGYFDLNELDWDHYREKYGNIYRLDRLLKAEGKSADNFKVAKQADTLQTFYNLDESEVTELLKNLGYNLSSDYLSKNLEYYLQRTSHGSTLSRVVHAQLANMIDDQNLSWELYKDALTSDYSDVQGGTTGEGIHAGVMAGTIIIALSSYAGINLKSHIVKINPKLPKHWRALQFNFVFKNVKYFIDLNKHELKVSIASSEKEGVEIEVQGSKYYLPVNGMKTISLSD